MPRRTDTTRRLGDFVQEARHRFGTTSFADRIDILIRILLMVVVAVGCYLIIEPFLTAILIAAVLAVVTWPVFEKIRPGAHRTATPAAILMVVGIIVVFLIPLSFALIAITQQLPKLTNLIGGYVKNPMPLIDATSDIPYVGAWLHAQLIDAIDPAAFSHTVQRMIEPVSTWVLNAAVNIGGGLVQLALVTFIVFFFYRDGPWFTDRIKALLERVSGGIAQEITGILVNTTRSVVFGLVGTAIGQGLVAGIGFWIADVPGILVLSSAVCLLSVVPIGPPLIWLPAAAWVYSQGNIGMAVFLVLWGTLAVSSVDNFLKPLLISRGSSLPISLIFLGVFGGVIAFGFLGVILGPLLLAIGCALFQAWLRRPAESLKNAPPAKGEKA